VSLGAPSHPANKLKYNVVIVGILLIAFALRVIAIDQIPAGLSHDEAYNGVTAVQLLQEHNWPIFFEINKGIEPLIIYLEALAFYAFGIGPVPLRLVNILFGMLTVALIYPFTRRLFNRRVALLAMAGIAVSFWAIFVSRLSLRAVLLPPLLLLTLYFFWRAQWGINKAHIGFYVLSGVAAGITMYTYLSSRFVPFIIAVMFVSLLLCRQATQRHWLGMLLHFTAWAVIFAPLGYYFLENTASFTHRASQVNTIPLALEGDVGPLIRNSLRTLGMFTFRGDTTDRYNLDGRPVFDWVNGLLFYVGLGLLLKQFIYMPGRAAVSFFLLSSTFFMLLPDLITDDSPHFLRTIGALPFVYIFWAVGLGAVAQRIGSRSTIFIFLLFSFMTIHTSFDYFYRWANAANARYIYGADIAEVAHHLKVSPAQDLAVISAEYYRDLDPFRFALHFQGRPPFVIWFDGRQTLAFPPPESKLSPRYIFPASAPIAEQWRPLLQYSASESGQAYDLYRLPPFSPVTQLQAKMKPVGLNVNDDLVLLGYQILEAPVTGEKVQILLGWQALRALPPGTDYTFLIQLHDQRNQLYAEVDGNGYDPGYWQPGVLGLQLLNLELPLDLPPQSYRLMLQVVDRQRGLALPTSTGEPSLILGSIELKPGQ